MAKSPGRQKKTSRFLPEGASDLLTRWVIQAGGLTVVTLGLALTAALMTYDSRDPSFNTSAAPVAVSNMLGSFGAALSDLLLQLFGVATWLLSLAMFAWGGRLMVTARKLEKVWLRGLFLLLALLLLAIGLAAVPIPSQMHLPGHATELGGSAGRLLLDGLMQTVQLLGGGGLAPVVALICGSLGAICAIYAFGLSWQEWRAVGVSVGQAGNQFGQVVSKVRSSSANLSDRWSQDEPSVAPPSQPVQADAPPARPRSTRRAAILSRRENLAAKRDERIEPNLFDTPQEDEEEDAPPPIRQRPAPNVAIERPAEPLVMPGPSRAQPGKREQDTRQGRLDLANPQPIFELPPLDILTPTPLSRGPNVNEDGLAQNARLLESVLEDFGVNGEIVKVRPGPVVTLYELEPAPGTKTSRVIGLADDIARSMSALSVRIATVPGRSVIGIELPNAKRETVYLRELLASEAFEKHPASLALVLGKDIGGQPMMADLARMPHLLIAGTTGSGKSVAINTMILSLLYRLTPDECRLIMIDPKMLELSVYDGIPHLLSPVVTEPGKAVVALKWAVREMEDRYRAMSQLGVRNIGGYNQRLAEARTKGESLSRTVQTGFDPDSGKPVYEDQALDLKPLPYIVIVVDEMADLMLVAGKDIEAAVQRLAQMARAAGIHLIMATQRPSVDVITGTIKANFPTRISFQVSSKIDSRTILGEQGAEQLLGQGDMLYMAAGGRITRVHGPFVSDDEVEKVVEHLRSQGEPNYVENVTEEEESDADTAFGGGGSGGSGEDLYDQAVALVAREGKASTSFIQRHLQIGYNRAARLMERMEKEGVVSKANAVGKREVLVRSHGD